MARDEKEVQAQLAAAKKQVLFNLDDLTKNQPRPDKAPKTDLRRRSLEPVRISANGQRTETAQKGKDGEAANDESADHANLGEAFRAACPREELIRFDYLPGHADNHDLPTRLEQLAEAYGRKGSSPGMLFAPLTEEGKAQWSNVSGVMDYNTFASFFEQDREALFLEMKLRTLMLSAREGQVYDLCTYARNLDAQAELLYHWSELMSQDIIDRDADTTKDEKQRQRKCRELQVQLAEIQGILDSQKDTIGLQKGQLDSLTQLVEERDSRISELETAVTDMTLEARTRGRDTPASHHTDQTSARTTGGGRSAKHPDPPLFRNDKTKDEISFDLWHHNLTEKLHSNGDWFADDRAKRAYVVSRLGGDAATNVQPYLANDHPGFLRTSKDLLDHLYSEYHDPNQRMTAKRDYEKLKLRNVEGYIAFRNDFVRLAGQCHKARADWKEDFYDKLPFTLQTALTTQFLDEGVDFEAFARFAQRVAVTMKMNYAAKDEAKGQGSSSKPAAKKINTNPTLTPRTNPRPTTVGGGRVRIPADKLRRLIDEGRCFVCEQTGHVGKDCPAKKKAPDREARVAAIMERWGSPTSTTAPAAQKSKDAPTMRPIVARDSDEDSEN